MQINHVTIVYFSGTGNTKKVLRHMARSFECEVSEVDLTVHEDTSFAKIFKTDELVIFGVPSFYGRVPELAAHHLSKMHGFKTPAVIVTTYGNREYDDTLIELRDIVSKLSFKVIAAAAIVATHSIVNTIAKDRPNADDLNAIKVFSENVRKKIEAADSSENIAEVSVRGNFPYKKISRADFTPKPTRACNSCKACAKSCPTGAIVASEPKHADHRKCIACMHCVAVCPTGARRVNPLVMKFAEKKLLPYCREPKSNEYIV